MINWESEYIKSTKNYVKSTKNYVKSSVFGKFLGEAWKQVKDCIYWSEETIDSPVRLSQLPFPNEQPVDSKTRYNADRLIVTRTDEDYRNTFVYLKDTLTRREIILIEILKVDLQHVGGLKLYLEDRKNGGRELLFADAKSERSDCILFWMDGKYILCCQKNGKIHRLGQIQSEDAGNCKLVCEMYGAVQQIRAYVGQYKKKEESHGCGSSHSNHDSKDDSVDELPDALSSEATDSQNESPEEPESNDVFLTIIQNQHSALLEEIIIPNLPPIKHSSSNSELATCSKVETCKICMDKDADTVIIPCGHLISCYECASRVTTRCGSVCPMCRAEIEDCRKIFDRKIQCQSCRMNSANVLLIPCGDMCLCDSCSAGAKNCPVCLMFVNTSQKVIFCTS